MPMAAAKLGVSFRRVFVLRLVNESRHAGGRCSRRELLRLGGLGVLGSLASKLHASPGAERGAGHGRARSVLVIYTSGGMSQLETWDPKPEAPEEIRGA